jgi:hypothetical protein
MITATTACSSFKHELLLGVHDFAVHEFRLALYEHGAPLGADTTIYLPDFEVAGFGYTAGGQTLAGLQIFLDSAARVAYATFNDAVWPDSVITARGALLYNQTADQRAIVVLDFGADRISNHAEFRVQFPPAQPSTAVIRIE